MSPHSDMDQYVKTVVAQAPPLTNEQRDRIATLLRASPPACEEAA